jgi:hypothetical protein
MPPSTGSKTFTGGDVVVSVVAVVASVVVVVGMVPRDKHGLHLTRS